MFKSACGAFEHPVMTKHLSSLPRDVFSMGLGQGMPGWRSPDPGTLLPSPEPAGKDICFHAALRVFKESFRQLCNFKMFSVMQTPSPLT